MAISKVSLILNAKNQSGDNAKTTLGYVNPDIIDSTDTTVISTGKTRLRDFAIAINGLTTNDLISIELQTTEDITNIS